MMYLYLFDQFPTIVLRDDVHLGFFYCINKFYKGR